MTAPTAPQAPQRPNVRSSRLMATLAIAGGVAGLAIVSVYGWTQPTIQAYKARVLAAAVEEVLQGPASYDTLYVVDGGLSPTVPPGAAAEDFETVYLGYRADGTPIGYAGASGEPGFQDIVRLIFGYDAATGAVLGMKVLESKETPGLGDKIEKDMTFVTQFDGALAPLVGVKPRDASGDPHEIDMITGATISSKTVIKVINNAIARWGPGMTAYLEEARP